MPAISDSAMEPATIRVRGVELAFGARTWVMGIINVTPDSFSGDGLVQDGKVAVRDAVAQARQMVDQGANLLDIGGESTRPGHHHVSPSDELARIEAVVAATRKALPAVPISVDTSKPEVAEAALAAGADIINDVAAVTDGVALAPLAATSGAPYVVTHGRRQSVYEDVISEVIADLRLALDAAEAAGCAREALIVDPGIGFGKTAEQNLALLRELRQLRVLGRPVLLGASRKSTIGRVLGLDADQRLEGTLATTALGIASGVDIVRVHDVAANVRVVQMSDAIIRGGWHDTETQSL